MMADEHERLLGGGGCWAKGVLDYLTSSASRLGVRASALKAMLRASQ